MIRGNPSSFAAEWARTMPAKEHSSVSASPLYFRALARATNSSGCEAPRKKEKLLKVCSSTYTRGLRSLGEYAVHVPALGPAFLKNPEPGAMGACNVVIACHAFAIPPAAFDAFGTLQYFRLRQGQRFIQQPHRTRQLLIADFLCNSGLGSQMQFMDAPPCRFRPVFRNYADAVYRLLAQTCAQALHQLRRAVTAARAGESCKDIERTCREPPQGTGNKFHASNRRSKLQPRQFLAKHIAQAPPFAAVAGQAQLHPSCRSFPMLQFQQQCLDTGLALAQESRAALDQGFE